MKIALIGYGKMGHIIESIAKSRGHEIVSIIDINNRSDFDSDAFRSAEVAIEFTAPTAAFDNITSALKQGVKVVSGSTGWLDRLPQIKAICDEDPSKAFFYSSNYSIGVNIFFAVNKYLAKIMNRFSQYSVSMNEIHHIHKLDHPSGTAITLAEGIAENIDALNGWTEDPTKANSSVLINHERRGEVPGTHIIEYRSGVDRIEITHEAFSREGFALGAVVAAEWMHDKTGFRTMDELMAL